MLSLYIKAQDALHRLHTREEGQDAFEYLLVVGAVSVGIVIAMATPVGTTLANLVVDGVETAIDGVLNII